MHRIDRTLAHLLHLSAIVGTLATLSLTAAWASDRSSTPPNAAFEARFEQADLDHDGRLTRAEAAPWPNLADHFTEADLDHDGSLSLPEFIQAMQPMR